MTKNTHLDENKVRKLKDLQEAGVNPYPYTFNQTHHAKDILKRYEKLKKEEHSKDSVSIAGRVMLRRIMGKAGFMHLQDETGRIQFYISKDTLGDKLYKIFAKKVDLGDIVGVEGTIFKTKMGEVTVKVKKAEILCKSLLMLPEKYHGLKDIEIKYRQRHLDLITNPDTKEVFIKRSKMIKVIRDYFAEKEFMEVETPILQTIYGGANAKPFETHINAWKMKMYLSISPELYLKRLLVGGFEKVFTICKNFRNEDVDTTHNPEFTMLEIYQAYVDYNVMMEYLEEVYEKACIAMNGTTKVKHVHNGKEVEIEFKSPWKRLSMSEAIKKHTKLNVKKMSEKEILEMVKKHKIKFDGPFSWGLGVQLLFEEFVEDQLIQPVHIIDHPKESTPLCKTYRKDPRLIERFESFCLGMEISNAYSELNDPILQRELLECQAKDLRAGSEEAHPMDEDFVTAMEYGMPPAGGLGFGIDRMAIILTGVDSIRDVIFFPTMKPKIEDKKD
jgi:lysyl-tRNA synthetase, class II